MAANPYVRAWRVSLRELKPEHIDDGAHPGSESTRYYQPFAGVGKAERSCSTINGCGPDCTSERSKTHVTEALEVLYPWHPWFGGTVYIHEVIERGGERSFRCDLDAKQTARCMEVPAWMFDRAACLRVRHADVPQVEVTALGCLKALLAEVVNRTSATTAVVGARHPFEGRGDADATPQSSITNSSTRSVSSVESSVTRLAMPVGRGAGESDALDSADAQQSQSLRSSRPQRRGRRR